MVAKKIMILVKTSFFSGRTTKGVGVGRGNMTTKPLVYGG